MTRTLFPRARTSRTSCSLPSIAAIISIAMLSILLLSCQPKETGNLVVWTYDSFVSEWGPATPLAKLYEETTGTKIEFVSKGDGGALLASILAAGKKAGADLVIGLDDNLAARALDSGLFAAAKPANLASIRPELLIDDKNRLLPFDYGNFTFIWDSESGINPPENLEALTRPEYAKKIIIMDPRTSTPGLGFLAWTQAVYKDGWKDYWKRLGPSVLAMTPGWDTGYGLFTKGEAPLVLSYSTSPAYHKAYEESERYKALVFPEGHSAQIELAGVLAASRNRKDAEKFLDFLLSAEAQALLPETQWMYPANTSAVIPPSFSVVPANIATLKAGVADLKNDPETAASILAEAAR
ncbi:MAG: thiamine ABC transporter substrate-binding protein [Spirochaetae bacterium HGW-Spirochaetae-9]|nr:MAG: thiamine ABC transporter substrate-binding protein [Spirochaetae bacterium HGW-Spirochaetae-9]